MNQLPLILSSKRNRSSWGFRRRVQQSLHALLIFLFVTAEDLTHDNGVDTWLEQARRHDCYGIFVVSIQNLRTLHNTHLLCI